MKRNIVQTLALTTVLASTIIGVTPTEAQAFTVNLGNGKVYDYNVETQEKKDLTESDYNEIVTTTKQSQGQLHEGYNIPSDVRSLSDIVYVKDGQKANGFALHGDTEYFKDGIMQTGWVQTNKGWQYFDVSGTVVSSGYINGYKISNGVYNSTANDFLKDNSNNVLIYLNRSTTDKSQTTVTQQEFTSLLSQGKVGVKTQLVAPMGGTIENAVETLVWYLK